MAGEVIFIVANEVEDFQIALIRIFAKAPPQLLDKDDGRRRRAQHDDLIDLRNIDAFIKDVASKDIIQIVPVLIGIGFQMIDGCLPLPFTRRTRQGQSPGGRAL